MNNDLELFLIDKNDTEFLFGIAKFVANHTRMEFNHNRAIVDRIRDIATKLDNPPLQRYMVPPIPPPLQEIQERAKIRESSNRNNWGF